MGALKLSKTVAVDVVDPNRDFYVEAAHVGHLVNVLAARACCCSLALGSLGKPRTLRLS